MSLRSKSTLFSLTGRVILAVLLGISYSANCAGYSVLTHTKRLSLPRGKMALFRSSWLDFPAQHPIRLMDEAYAELLKGTNGKPISSPLCQDLLSYYADLEKSFATKARPEAWQNVIKERSQGFVGLA
jgi:hypothetical protein